MENASKALIMAGGVLIGILIISLAVYLFVDFGSTSAEINAQKAQKQIAEFNSKFTAYETYKDNNGKWQITIYDIVSLAGYAKEYNDKSGGKIAVNINNGGSTIKVVGMKLENLIKSHPKLILDDYETLIKYECDNISYDNEGRVQSIIFKVCKN